MDGKYTNNYFPLLLTVKRSLPAGRQVRSFWEAVRSFWEAVGSKTSHILIEYQSVSLKVRRNKNLRKKIPHLLKCGTKGKRLTT